MPRPARHDPAASLTGAVSSELRVAPTTRPVP